MSRNTITLVALAGLLVLTSRPALAARGSAADYTAIDRYVQSEVDANHFPGVALAVVEGETLAHAAGFGHDAQGQPVTPQTPFMIGSNSKSFTALAVMQLVEAGQIELDAPVQRYLPTFRVADAGASARITVRHLLNQTSGLPSAAAGDILLEFRPVSSEEGLAALRDVQLHAPPGTTYQYANANYLLLGLLIEAVARQPYATYVQQHILDPLHMTNSRLASGNAIGYRFWFGVPVPDPMPYAPAFASVPTGGVVSTAEDMSHYLAMYLNQGQFRGQRLLSPAGIGELERGVSRVTFTEGDRTITLDYAMGWATGDIAGVPAVYHTGGSPQFSSWMVLVPSQDRAFITLTNANNWIPGPGLSSTELIPKGVMQLLQGETPERGTSLRTMYAVIDGLGAAALLALGWSLLRVARRPMLVGWPAGVPLVWEFGVAIAVLVGLPQLFEVHTWAHVIAYVPDLGVLAILLSALWLTTGGMRIRAIVSGLRSVPAGVGERHLLALPKPQAVVQVVHTRWANHVQPSASHLAHDASAGPAAKQPPRHGKLREIGAPSAQPDGG
jgi:CubicO group peptidase (beta-lactamase class C family)